MFGSFRRLQPKWQILLAVQGVVTMGILAHRVHLIERQKEHREARREMQAREQNTTANHNVDKKS